jgi:hypothetical protein
LNCQNFDLAKTASKDSRIVFIGLYKTELIISIGRQNLAEPKRFGPQDAAFYQQVITGRPLGSSVSVINRDAAWGAVTYNEAQSR